jgi:hypothetical protein
VASIINISKRANGASVHACFPEHIPTKQIFPSPSPYAPGMAVWSAMPVQNQLFPSTPNPFPQSFHEHPVFICHTTADQNFPQRYEVNVQCNRSVAENAPQKVHNPPSDSLGSDKCWVCVDLYPVDCFHRLRVCPHREDPLVRARDLPYIKELAQRQRPP